MYVIQVRQHAQLFDSPCPPEIYLPSEMKVEPDPSLVRDEFSVIK